MHRLSLSVAFVVVLLASQARSLTENNVRSFSDWNNVFKDNHLMFDVLLENSRTEMSRWMREINAQFVSQVGFTTDRLNGMTTALKAECSEKIKNAAGEQIQEIVREVIADLDFYQRDYVFLLLDVTDQYVSFSQKWTQIAWFGLNLVTDFRSVLSTAEMYAESYQQMFEISVEEILIEMGHFSRLVDATRQRAFAALNAIEEQSQRNFVSCF